MFVGVIPFASVAALSFAVLGGFGFNKENAPVILFTSEFTFIVDGAAVRAPRFAVHAADDFFFFWGGGRF